jgi:hypothetical protein
VKFTYLQDGVIKCQKSASRYQAFSEDVLVCSEVLTAYPSTNMIDAPFGYRDVSHFERCKITSDLSNTQIFITTIEIKRVYRHRLCST